MLRYRLEKISGADYVPLPRFKLREVYFNHFVGFAGRVRVIARALSRSYCGDKSLEHIGIGRLCRIGEVIQSGRCESVNAIAARKLPASDMRRKIRPSPKAERSADLERVLCVNASEKIRAEQFHARRGHNVKPNRGQSFCGFCACLADLDIAGSLLRDLRRFHVPPFLA